MSSFEVVVRPVVLPNIRPQPPRVLAPLDDPERGIAKMSGSGGGMISLPRSSTLSIQKQFARREHQRTYDVDTVYEKDAQGNVNRENFVDVERIKNLKLTGLGDEVMELVFQDPPPADNVETTQTNLVRNAKDNE